MNAALRDDRGFVHELLLNEKSKISKAYAIYLFCKEMTKILMYDVYEYTDI